ncbi:Signal recognition particle 19 kDa protein [Galdieria sulphuraria]|uniref:Signal recognition particle subunit SRP19 isoform 2 n=1 Tax=Galdieria sulphuraria TaxID=130081 RepID=M2Y0N7_GALSU|nr:signal recognition particle subunit SRP19 isoform 2 [Galdieria sulphuraria]EME29488.1 signal recognition particle subunit SRP19 isoform 2 [Galdieria sulphuraria]GJD05993.1 Signal recognition particle 19 kDa protein [Galdieria sulphuraria]|eukprot:XP_005706008.1 signal recognition particle subunit SRP19 isoform 2 [Galdieria sulphuraria]
MFAEDYDDQKTTPSYAKRWICIYPVYIDASCSLFQGRKISKHLCSDTPSAEEIAKSCEQLGFETLLESDKKHPRDNFRKGRIRVHLFNEQHKSLVSVIETSWKATFDKGFSVYPRTTFEARL